MFFWDTRKPRDLPLDMLFWGPGPKGYAFLGHQKTKGFAIGYAFLGTGVQWICFFGIPENQGICHWICFFGARGPKDMLFGTPENQGICHWICFFGARSPMDMLFWDTRKTKGFATGYAFLGPGVQWICLFGIPDTRKPRELPVESNGYFLIGIPENQGICHWKPKRKKAPNMEAQYGSKNLAPKMEA